MNDTEDHLRRLTPRRAPAKLRSQVLAGMSRELRLQRTRRSDQRWLLLAASVAALVFAFAGWSQRDGSQRLTRALGPRPIPSSVIEIVAAIDSAPDSERAKQLTRRLMPSPGRSSTRAFDASRYRQLWNEINIRG